MTAVTFIFALGLVTQQPHVFQHWVTYQHIFENVKNILNYFGLGHEDFFNVGVVI